MVPPFIWIRGRLAVVANWTDDLREGDWLLLRPATRAEVANYLDRVGDAEEEAHYTSVLNDDDRLDGR